LLIKLYDSTKLNIQKINKTWDFEFTSVDFVSKTTMSEKKLPIQLKRELRAKMKELKPLIRGGAIKQLAEELEVSPNLIYDVVGGRRWNLEVIEGLTKIGQKNLKRVEAATKAIDEIIEAKRKAAK